MRLGHHGETAARETGLTNPKRLTSVAFGFLGLLILMGVLVVDSACQLRDATLDSSLFRQQTRDRDAILDDLRTNIYHASTIVRDYLLEPGKDFDPNLSMELESIRAANSRLLSQYGELVRSSESDGFRQLRQREAAYMDALVAAVPSQTSGTQQDRQLFFRQNALPHRSEPIQLVAQVNALDQRDMTSGEERIQDVESRFQRRVGAVSLAAFIVSAILAVIVMLRYRYPEHQASRHFAEIQAARHDLRLLSNRLVAAQEEERRNLSRELHDEVGQSMTAMLIDLARLESRLQLSDNCRQLVLSIRHAAEENVARIRDLSLLLRPSMLDELGLVPALQWQVREVARRSGLKVRLIADELDEELPDAHRTCVYRIVQEALNNCVKHAGATEARVVVRRDENALLVSVQDNGTGFDPKLQKGLGLLGIDERAMRIGGSFRVESRPGAGAVLSVRLPLPDGKPDALQAGVA